MQKVHHNQVVTEKKTTIKYFGDIFCRLGHLKSCALRFFLNLTLYRFQNGTNKLQDVCFSYLSHSIKANLVYNLYCKKKTMRL